MCPSHSRWPTSPMRTPPLRRLPILSPTAPLPLHHHSQCGDPLSSLVGVANQQILCRAQAVEPGASVCCPIRPLMTHLQWGHHPGSSRPSDPRPVDQDTSVGRVGASPPHPGSTGTPHQPGHSLLSSPHRFTHHITGSTSSNLSSLGDGHCPHHVPSPGRLPPRPRV